MVRILNQYISVRSFFLLVTESLLVLLSLLGAATLQAWRDSSRADLSALLPQFEFASLAIVVCLQACFYYAELYEPPMGRVRQQLQRLLGAWTVAAAVLVLLVVVFPLLRVAPETLLAALLLFLPASALTRLLLAPAWQRTVPGECVLILGTGNLATEVACEIAQRADLPLRLTGLIGPASGPAGPERVLGRRVLGDLLQLERIVRDFGIGRIIVALEDRRDALPAGQLLRLRSHGIRIDDAHTALAALTGRVRLGTVRPSWLVFGEGFHRGSYYRIVKRTMDVALSLAGLLLSAPLLLLLAVAVKFGTPGPILYRQRRVGLQGVCFEVLKLRTMTADAESSTGAQWAQPDDPRVTPVGRWLRKYRLDELPQLVNVLRGQMSLVGPRPERPEFVQQLREELPYYDLRHTVRPGLTGWAQVRYTYGATVDDAFRKLEYDVFYLKNMCFLLDLQTLLRTVRIVFFGRGAR